ncbi:MAG: 1-(5-phosphoribosyl)-5-[(5-phosphoribosylamino)methylideneamino]imidazole-4-carboxamide isomerase [Dysgonamonadaceae bacterium]|jgi:phosphoribosylformimino-5-aminoimidazole carboxamide ribotide isomerase|nr:1-(5-phosphoribosyl)-5-[(5-phosphoribosylamino)methylideneamino]imidazole-4-carboxamide isomerase [Dysgonamonadaceae bacterium]
MIGIIPAIDVIDGKCVRLSQGDYQQKTVYNEDPLEVAKWIEDCGIRRLHLVDLDGAKASRIINHKALEKIATHTSLVIDFGGGLKSDDDLRIAFECGASMVTGGSIAVKDPEVFESWIGRYGKDKIILGADCRNEKVSVSGWTEDSTEEIVPFIRKWREKGIENVICTDISKDGMMQGPSLQLYRKIASEIPGVHLIASGGVSCDKDINLLDEAGIPEVIVGKAMYEGKIKL